jgi:ribosomal protein S18 acetylase RimI-like enzyme
LHSEWPSRTLVLFYGVAFHHIEKNLNYREAILSDLDQLRILEQKVVEAERPFNSSIKEGETTYYDIEGLITDNMSHLIVAEDAGNVIGSGYAQIRTSKESMQHDHHSYLGFMYVSPEHRGTGINKQIIEILISWSKTQGMKDFYLDVYSENAPAIRAYEKIGFTPCFVEMKLNF